MRTCAAVAMEAGKPLKIVEVDLEDPKSGEVFVEIKATGICQTDEFTRSGADPKGMFPTILGHVGAEITTRLLQLVTRRVWRGTASSAAHGRTDVPKIVDWYTDRKIEIDPTITHTMPLEDINNGFDLMHAGTSIVPLVEF